jgi:hypothetical protein
MPLRQSSKLMYSNSDYDIRNNFLENSYSVIPLAALLDLADAVVAVLMAV